MPKVPVPSSSNRGIDMDELARAMSQTIADHQMALRVIFELIDDGAGTAAQLAERMTEKAEDGEQFAEQHVDDALAILDQFALLSWPDPDSDDERVELWS